MDADLQAVKTALAKLSNRELRTLVSTTKQMPPLAPGLLAWIEHAANWEIERRQGRHSVLQSPATAIDPGEHERSAMAAAFLRGLFVTDAPPVSVLFDAIVRTLGRNRNLH